jgi:ligand-binding sensor domain-containing protein
MIIDGTSWISYNTTDGMASDVNYAVCEDVATSIMVGHEIRGVSVFDGSTWTIYAQTEGLLSSYVNDMCEDKEGNMLFATSNGISKFDVTLDELYNINSGIPTNYIDAIGRIDMMEHLDWLLQWDKQVRRNKLEQFFDYITLCVLHFY